jgi:hypothetical protein
MRDSDIEVAEDGWTTTTRDRAPVAHFEHTIAITEEGPDILTDRGGEDREDNDHPAEIGLAAAQAGKQP